MYIHVYKYMYIYLYMYRYEPERGSAVAGHRGYFLKDVGVLLNQVRPSVSYLFSFASSFQSDASWCLSTLLLSI